MLHVRRLWLLRLPLGLPDHQPLAKEGLVIRGSQQQRAILLGDLDDGEIILARSHRSIWCQGAQDAKVRKMQRCARCKGAMVQ